MEMHWIDWSILGALFAGLLWLLLYCRKFVRNTADFLAANRCAERYILAIASGIGAVGAISIIAFFELYYNAGFTPVWAFNAAVTRAATASKGSSEPWARSTDTS